MKKKLTAMLLAAGAMLGAWARTYTAADFGKVVCADGSVYATAADASSAGKTALAMIACVDGNYVLAIALADTSTTGLTWSEAIESVGTWAADKAVASGQWRLPSADDYKRIFAACGGSAYTTSLTEDMGFSWGDIQTMLSSAGGTQFDGLNTYWLSDKASEGTAWGYRTNLQKFRSYSKSNFWCLARAVLAFGTARTYKKVQLWENGPYWAETNIGADEPWDSGYHFWWGDTIGYKRENNKWVASDGSSSDFSFESGNTPTYNKGVATLQSEGWITADGVLHPTNDAAHVQWGGEWRMPTYQEMEDLDNKCDWTLITTNGVYGFVVRGKGAYAPASIFLPCVGVGSGTSLTGVNSDGAYCSATLDRPSLSWSLLFSSAGWHNARCNRYCCDGCSIRPVQDAPTVTVGSWTSGDCTVTLDSAGALTVSGTGAMAAYESSYSRPWYDNCNQIKSVVIEHGVTNIGDYAFYDCGNLTNVTIGDSVTSIGMMAFYNCASLAGIAIPAGVASIGDGAFKGCVSLADGDGFVIVKNFLYDYTGAETSVAIPDGIVGIGLETFKDLASLTGVTIPDSVDRIGVDAFENCDNLVFDTATIPGVKMLCGWAVDYNSSFPDDLDLSGVRGIGDGAFSGCDTLKSVAIPDGITRIGIQTFLGCASLASVTIPSSVAQIGDSVFSDCTSMADVYCYPDAADLAWGRAMADFKADGTTKIHVKASQLAAYQEKFGANVRATFVGDLDMAPAVTAAINAIDAIGEVAYTDESKAKIDAARAAYDALTNDQKALVANIATLTAAEATYAALTPAPPPPPVEPPPVEPAPCYAVIDEADIVAPYAPEKAVTLKGAAYDGCDVVGIVELKLGKVNAKKKTSKVSGSVTTLDGKKHTAKGVAVTGIEGTSPATVSLEVKGLGTMAVTIGGAQFAGTLGGTYHVQSADVGGAWAGGSAVVSVEPDGLSAFSGVVLSDFLPTHEVAAVSGGKWKFPKAASVKWAKPKKGAALPEIYDEASGKGLVVDTAKGTNLSGLKLTYTPKKGTFKGTFNVYALEGSGSATKLKKHKFSVSGLVVGGTGYGVAKCKKPAAEWSVTVK